MQAVQYTERAPVYGQKGQVVTSGLVQHTAPPASHPATKQVLLDTRDDKLRISYQQSLDKEALSLQPTASYEKKGDERLDRVDPPKPAIVQQMSKPLPSLPAVGQSSAVVSRATSESEPQYVTVYEDGAQLFSPRTINLLGTAARLPPPPAPPVEPTTPTATMQFEPTPTAAYVPPQPIEPTIVDQPQPVPQAPVLVQPTPQPALVAVPSWPPAASEHSQAVTKRVVEASTVREESPLMEGVEKVTPSPLIVSAGPQPYELAHPKNAIDVVQLPPAQPNMPAVAAETVAQNVAPLPLLPPAQKVAPATKPASAPLPLPAPVVSTAAIPALPVPIAQVPRPLLPTTSYQQAQPRIMPAVVRAPAAPRRQWKMPRMSDVLLSPYAIGLYVCLLAAMLLQLPFWLLVTLAVLLDAAFVAYRRGPAKQTSLAVIPASAKRPLPLPAPVVSTAVIPALPAPTSAPAPQPQYERRVSRETGTQTELTEEEQIDSVVVPHSPASPAEFFAALRQQHGGSPVAADKPVGDRTPRQFVQIKKLAPSARQQATVPLLADAQAVAPAGVVVDTAASGSSEVSAPQRYVQTAQTVQAGSVLPSPSKLPNPMLDALNSASPRRELKELSEAVESYHDMLPASTLPAHVEAAARRAGATIPAPAAAAGIQGAANPSVMVPTWPPSEQQHSVAQARQVVEASTVRDHSALLDDSDSSSTAAALQSQPYEMVQPPHSRTAVNRTSDMMALPAPTAPVSTTAPLALPVPIAPSFRVSAADVTPATSIQRVVQTTNPLPLSGQPLTAEEHPVNAVKQVMSEEKEEAVVADVGETDRVSDVGTGIVNDSGSLRLRHVAAHVHSQ